MFYRSRSFRALICTGALALGISLCTMAQEPAPKPIRQVAAPQPAEDLSSTTPPKVQGSQDSALSSSATVTTPPPAFWSGKDPNAQVTVLEDTLFRVRINEPLSTRNARIAAPLLFTLSEDVVVDGFIVIPRGASVHGAVVESKQSGSLAGRPDLVLKLTSLDLGNRHYPLYSYQFRVEGASKSKPTETKVKTGAVVGAIALGALSGSAKGESTAAGKLAGAGTGAALGAGAGALVSAVTPGPTLTIPAESEIDFYLASPISVVPLSPADAAKLSQGLRRGGPVLYVRGSTP